MKTKTWVVLTLVFCIAAMANATDLPKMNVEQVEENTAVVAYTASTEAPLLVSITNANGEILYYKETEHCKEFKKELDLTKLGDGNFCVCINYGNQSVSRKICVKDKKVVVDETTRCFEPYFCVKEKRLNVSFLNQSLKPVYLNVYRNGRHVKGMNLGRDLTIHQALDFSKLTRGTYEVVLTDNIKDHKFKAQL
ncbi:hypothetical protein [uncultured Draconibacterium sp.]|uniref:hypothetical protein n=1 Tax=uncultured Draconibacterium sp. TaxID=1573823 RepID=UPI003260FC51